MIEKLGKSGELLPGAQLFLRTKWGRLKGGRDE